MRLLFVFLITIKCSCDQHMISTSCHSNHHIIISCVRHLYHMISTWSVADHWMTFNFSTLKITWSVADHWMTFNFFPVFTKASTALLISSGEWEADSWTRILAFPVITLDWTTKYIDKQIGFRNLNNILLVYIKNPIGFFWWHLVTWASIHKEWDKN